MTPRALHSIFTLAVTFLVTALAPAGAGAASAEGAVSPNDRQFIVTAAQGGWAEVHAGEFAQKNGASDAVKQFGARMIKDHGMANKELEAIAGKLGITPPKEPDPKHQADAQMM